MTTTSVLFKNARLLDPLLGELQEGRDILIEQGRVKEVSDRPIRTQAARRPIRSGRPRRPTAHRRKTTRSAASRAIRW